LLTTVEPLPRRVHLECTGAVGALPEYSKNALENKWSTPEVVLGAPEGALQAQLHGSLALEQVPTPVH
jgi:hypothetical protein